MWRSGLGPLIFGNSHKGQNNDQYQFEADLSYMLLQLQCSEHGTNSAFLSIGAFAPTARTIQCALWLAAVQHVSAGICQ